MSETITLEVLRYHPETDSEPHFQRYTVPYKDEWVVLDALNHIKDNLDATLSYRWSCHMAVCGSCGMMINNEPKLSCHTFLRDYCGGVIRVEPLDHFPIERDLVIVMDGFMEKLSGVKPWLIPKVEKPLSEGEYLQTPGEMQVFQQYTQCINCMLCYAACPQFGANPDFIGPGAMAMLQRYNSDSRDGGRQLRLDQIHGEDGVWACTAVGMCSDVCPKQVDPANAVNQNKTNSALDFFLRAVRPGAHP